MYNVSGLPLLSLVDPTSVFCFTLKKRLVGPTAWSFYTFTFKPLEIRVGPMLTFFEFFDVY